MCSEVIIFFFFFYYTKILKTAAISPLHTGHSETALEQLAQRQRWPHGTTAYSGSPSLGGGWLGRSRPGRLGQLDKLLGVSAIAATRRAVRFRQ